MGICATVESFESSSLPMKPKYRYKEKIGNGEVRKGLFEDGLVYDGKTKSNRNTFEAIKINNIRIEVVEADKQGFDGIADKRLMGLREQEVCYQPHLNILKGYSHKRYKDEICSTSHNTSATVKGLNGAPDGMHHSRTVNRLPQSKQSTVIGSPRMENQVKLSDKSIVHKKENSLIVHKETLLNEENMKKNSSNPGFKDSTDFQHSSKKSTLEEDFLIKGNGIWTKVPLLNRNIGNSSILKKRNQQELASPEDTYKRKEIPVFLVKRFIFHQRNHG